MRNLTVEGIGILVFCFLIFLSGCGGSGDVESPATAPPQTTSQAPKAPFVPLDACSLLTKSDVEALAGTTVMEPVKEELGNLVTCTFGDPNSPQTSLLEVDVLTGEEGAYFAGPEAQAKDSFESARRNAGSPQSVSALGEDAYWDETLEILRVYKGKYLVSIESGKGLDFAKSVAEKALAKLP